MGPGILESLDVAPGHCGRRKTWGAHEGVLAPPQAGSRTSHGPCPDDRRQEQLISRRLGTCQVPQPVEASVLLISTSDTPAYLHPLFCSVSHPLDHPFFSCFHCPYDLVQMGHPPMSSEASGSILQFWDTLGHVLGTHNRGFPHQVL